MMNRLIKWLVGRHVEIPASPEPAPIYSPVLNYTAPRELVIETNPMRKRLVLLRTLQALDRDTVMKVVEIWHELALADMAEGVSPRIEGKPGPTISPTEAGIFAARGLWQQMNDLGRDIQQLSFEIAKQIEEQQHVI